MRRSAPARAASQAASAAAWRRPSGDRRGSAGPSTLSTRSGRAWRISSSSLHSRRTTPEAHDHRPEGQYRDAPWTSSPAGYCCARLSSRPAVRLVPRRARAARLPRVRRRRAGDRGRLLPRRRVPRAGQRRSPASPGSGAAVAPGARRSTPSTSAWRPQGVDILPPTDDRAWGLRECWIADPDGVRIATHRGPRRPPAPPACGELSAHAPHKDRRHPRPGLRPPGVIGSLLDAGVDMVRLGLAHGTVDEHRAAIDLVRAAGASTGGDRWACSPTCPGPRCARARSPRAGRSSPRATRSRWPPATGESGSGHISVDEPRLTDIASPGATIVLGDGTVTLTVTAVDGRPGAGPTSRAAAASRAGRAPTCRPTAGCPRCRPTTTCGSSTPWPATPTGWRCRSCARPRSWSRCGTRSGPTGPGSWPRSRPGPR